MSSSKSIRAMIEISLTDLFQVEAQIILVNFVCAQLNYSALTEPRLRRAVKN